MTTEKNPDITGGGNAARIASEELRSYIERIERLQDEQQVIGEDIKEVKAEAKAKGYDLKVIAEMLRLRRLDAAEREEREALRRVYGEALGVFG